MGGFEQTVELPTNPLLSSPQQAAEFFKTLDRRIVTCSSMLHAFRQNRQIAVMLKFPPKVGDIFRLRSTGMPSLSILLSPLPILPITSQGHWIKPHPLYGYLPPLPPLPPSLPYHPAPPIRSG